MPTILVLGYTGNMGARIVRLLQVHVPAVHVIGASRNPISNSKIEARVLDYKNSDTFLNALKNIDCLIHAAGPFDHDPTPLVQACVNRNIHYIDIAESDWFINKVHEACDRPTVCSVAVVSGCSTVPGLVACLSPHLVSKSSVSQLDVLLNLGSNNLLSHGLCYSLLRPIGAKKSNKRDRWFRRLSRVVHLNGRVRHYGSYPIPFGEAIIIGKKKIPINFAMGFDRAYMNYLLFLVSFGLPYLSNGVLHHFCRLILPLGKVIAKLGTTEGRLTLVARDDNGEAQHILELSAIEHGLDIPAITTVWAVQRLLFNGATPGCIGLEQLVSSSDAITQLKRLGYELNERLF